MDIGLKLGFVALALTIIVALLWKEISVMPPYIKWPGAAFGCSLVMLPFLSTNPSYVAPLAIATLVWGVGWSVKNDLSNPFRRLQPPIMTKPPLRAEVGNQRIFRSETGSPTRRIITARVRVVCDWPKTIDGVEVVLANVTDVDGRHHDVSRILCCLDDGQLRTSINPGSPKYYEFVRTAFESGLKNRNLVFGPFVNAQPLWVKWGSCLVKFRLSGTDIKTRSVYARINTSDDGDIDVAPEKTKG